MSLHSFETVLLEMPESPMACTRSSTRRVDTPPIHASWITATSAFSDVRRGSRNPRKEGALPQLRHPQVQRAEPRLQLALTIAVAPGLAAVAALVAAGPD